MNILRNLLSSLRVRIMLLVLVSALPALVLTLYNGVEQRRQETLRVNENLLRLARLVASQQESLMASTHDLLHVLAEIPGISLDDVQSCNRLVSPLTGQLPAYTGINVADVGGSVECSSVANFHPTNVADRDYFQMALQTRDFVVGSYVIGRLTGRPIQPFAMPHVDESGQVNAILIASVDLNWFDTLVPTLQLPADHVLLYVGPDGTILYRYPDLSQWSGKQLPESPLIQAILNEHGEGTAEVPGVDGVERLYSITPVHFLEQDGGYISIGVVRETAYAEVNRRMERDLWLLGLVTLVALALAWLIGQAFILRRINLILEAARQLAGGDLSARTGIQADHGEIPQLAQAFDRMADSIQERNEALRASETSLKQYSASLERSNRDLQDFAYISSHDLQEPLRKIQAFGERLSTRCSGMLDEESLMYVERMQNAAERMQTMINDLLAYSRVSTRAQAFRLVDLHKVAREVVSDLEVTLHETGGQVEIEALPTIEAEPHQMHQLLQNLIANGLKFHRTEEKPSIRVYSKLWGEASSPESVQIIVDDNGIGFDMKYLERIFLPFQRLHGRTEYPGTGIGLAICRKIVERHGGTITAESAVGKGARFFVTLPVRQPKGEEMNK